MHLWECHHVQLHEHGCLSESKLGTFGAQATARAAQSDWLALHRRGAIHEGLGSPVQCVLQQHGTNQALSNGVHEVWWMCAQQRTFMGALME